MTPTGRSARSSEGEGRVVLMADRGPDGPRLGAALREAGFSLVSCDVVALPERVARIEPLAVVLDVEQPHAEVAVAGIFERRASEVPLVVAVGSEERAGTAGLVEGPRVARFTRPVPVLEVLGFLQDAAAAAAVRTEVPSSVGSLPFAADSDALLVSDFPALAGLPEVESILPDLEGRPASSRNAGELSPEIEALLDGAARRVRDIPDGESETSARSRVVPPEMMAAVDDFLLGDDDGPQTRGGVGPAPSGVQPGDRAVDRAGSERPEEDDPDAEIDREAVTASAIPSAHAPASAREHGSEHPRTAVGDATSIRAQKTEVGRIDGRAPSYGPPSDPSFTETPISSGAAGPLSPPRDGWRPQSSRNPHSAPALTDRMSRPGPRTEPPPTAMQPHVPYPPAPSAHPPAWRRSPSQLVDPPGPRARDEDGAVAIGRETDPIGALAAAVRARATGALVLTDASRRIARRILLRDGDLVNAASEHPDDALIAFLVERGDVAPELARRRPKLPQTGRHAAAALIANGILGQDDLWPVLRTHAEWIIARALRTSPAAAELEAEPPERLRAEPNVFGGAAGVEIFIDAVRRVISPEEALARLGGSEARLFEGPRSGLLAESALGDVEIDALRAGVGATLGEVGGMHGRELYAVLLGLAALEIVQIERPLGAQREEAAPSSFDPLDADAVRQRVRARLALVNEGDYFSLLGLTPAATPYEIKRAYLELRRAFEPSRLLTAATADLAPDVELIVEILEEAFDVLRDPRRRARYRRAIEASQPS